MNKKNFLLLFLCYILIIPVPLVKGAEENIYSPISFDIQLLSWNVINERIPKYSKFTILDIETGNQFKVQRRAGSQHADVQPLTVKDTKIMKEIYEGKWSWRRRAILIMVNDQWFAASMHGMPHGAGALANNFPGHFCVHFLGSTTHKTEKMDFSHKLMVYKAAGQLRQYLEQMNPNDAVKAFIAGIKEKDATILSYITTKQDWSSELALIENIKINRLNEVKPKVYEQALQVTLAIECNVYMKNARTRNMKKDLVLVRTSPLEGWKVKVEDSSI